MHEICERFNALIYFHGDQTTLILIIIARICTFDAVWFNINGTTCILRNFVFRNNANKCHNFTFPF